MSKVKFNVTGGMSGEFLSFLVDNSVLLENITPAQLGYTATCQAGDYRFIAKSSKKFQCRTRVTGKKGIYFKIRKYLRRKGIAVGCIAFFILNVLFSLMIWKININTTDRLVKSEIASILFENEIYPGVFYNQGKMDRLKNRIMQDKENISYIAFNFYKGVLSCEIYTVNPKENYTRIITENNIYAQLGGVITDLRVYSGFSQVQIGQSVSAGDLLVANETTTKYQHYSTSDTAAKIEGICKKEYSIFIPYNKKVKMLTGNTAQEKSLYFMGKEYKLKKAQIPRQHSKRTTVNNINVLGFNLPVTIKTDSYYEMAEVSISENLLTAQAKGRTRLDIMVRNDVKLKKELWRQSDFRLHPDGVEFYCVVEGYYDMI